MFDRLEALEKRYDELEHLLARPEVAVDYERLQALAKERASIEGLVSKYREYKKEMRRKKTKP